ncbi:MAG: DEAD/DEAH box helicase [Bacteroidia bacterium]|nr:DEAD/DEAH box helicase [Bacteroidia bacterium]
MTTFEEVGLQDDILQAIKELGFENPTPIQEKSIPQIINHQSDVLALASTGTGKTAAFGLPIAQKIDLNNKAIQALVLSPTRELCRQIAKDIENYTKHRHGFQSVSVYGGASIVNQIRDLKRGAHAVIGTPGRVVDLIERGNLILDNIDMLVLDEADEMLNMGFKDDLDFILSNTPSERQTLLFSATMPREVSRIAKRYMNDPVEIETARANQSAENIEHYYYLVNSRTRFEALRRIADVNPDIYGMVFCRTRRETQQVADNLIQGGYNADALHGDLSQAQRDHVMGKFRSKHLQILVATDVAARGLDVNDITHVINYNLPDELESYIHRSGRTARAGKKGESIALVTNKERSKVRILEKKISKSFEQRAIPTGKEICTNQLFKLVQDLKTVEVDDSEFAQYVPAITAELEGYSREELIQRFFSTEFNRFLSYYKDANDLNIKAKKEKKSRHDDDFDWNDRKGKKQKNRKERRGRVSFDRFFVNLGKKDSLNAQRLMGFINEQPQLEGIGIGRIEVLKTFSFVEVDENYSSEVLRHLNGKEFRGRRCNVEVAGNQESPRRDKKRKDNRKRDKRRR